MSERAYRPPLLPWPLLRHWILGYIPFWFILGVVIFIVQMVLSAMLHDDENLQKFLGLLSSAPKIIRAFIGGDALFEGKVENILAIGYQHPLVLIMLMINASVVPTALLTAQTEQGTMEILLARPVTRGRIYFMAVAIPTVGQAGLVSIVIGGTALWTRVFDFGQAIVFSHFVHIVFNLLALALAVLGISVLAGVVLNERGRALGLVVGYLTLSYLLDFTAVYWPRMEAIHPYTLFHYCVPNKIIKEGAFIWSDAAVLTGIYLACIVAGYVIWRRKDIATA